MYNKITGLKHYTMTVNARYGQKGGTDGKGGVEGCVVTVLELTGVIVS
jgi:hypothetical protein